VWNSTGLSCEESTLSAIDDMIGTVPAGLNQNIHTGQVPSVCDYPEFRFSASYYRVTEGTGSVDVVVTATMPGLSGYVTLQTENGNATAGTDYVLRNEPVNFSAGQNESIITIGIQDDSTYEGDEVFVVRLVDARVGGVTITRNEAKVVIEDDDEFGFCNHEITQTNTGNYTWEETEGNNTVLQGCALGPAQGIAVEDAVARRKCNMFGEWENPDTDNCITIVSRQFMDLQESITTITGENIEQITEDLREIVKGAREEVDQTQENLAVVVNVLVRTAAEVSERQTVVVVDEQTVNNIVETVDDLMVWPEAVLEQNSSRYIGHCHTNNC